jgi:hypothetical protein
MVAVDVVRLPGEPPARVHGERERREAAGRSEAALPRSASSAMRRVLCERYSWRDRPSPAAVGVTPSPGFVGDRHRFAMSADTLNTSSMLLRWSGTALPVAPELTRHDRREVEPSDGDLIVRGGPRMLDDAVYLPLRRGENELVMAVAEEFGGPGLAARLAGPRR